MRLRRSLATIFVIAAVCSAQSAENQRRSEHAGTIVTPDRLIWYPVGPSAAPSMPRGAQIAVLSGDPIQPGAQYTLGLKMPDGYQIPPHWYSTDFSLVVVKGTFVIGTGDTPDTGDSRELPAGSFIRLAKDVRNFESAKGETIIFASGHGPAETFYVNPADDPRKKSDSESGEKGMVTEFLMNQRDGSPVQNAPSGAARANYQLGANPLAAGGFVGTGLLGQKLGLPEGSGIRLGGALLLDGDWLMSGGVKPHSVTGNLVLGLSASIDTGRVFHIPGGQFGAEFLESQSMNTNGNAGTIQLFNNQSTGAPFSRQELNQLWWRQALFQNKLFVKAGKMNGASDFDQVLLPVPVAEPQMQDWTISDLTYAPAGLNPTLFSRLPGTPNNAWGVTGTFEPTKSLYTSYGLFDGNAGRFVQTGLNAWPDFNGYKFQIGEAGYAWRLHHEGKPGRIAAGAWHQSGKLLRPDYTYQNGDTGFYALGSQRLWYEHAGISPAGLTAFFQFGSTSSLATEVRRYAGAGLTAVSLIPGRPGDSFGVGLAWSGLNPLPNAGAFFSPGVPSAFRSFRPREIMWQAYYQAVLIPWFLTLQAGYSSIPEPGARPDIPWANALTVRFIVLF